MRLNNNDLFDLLERRGINKLYHANTVATSITFIEQGGLLSRGLVEQRQLYQTPQPSDAKDREVEVFNDIFLDTTDLHTYFSNRNFYGPVTFVFSVELLRGDFEVWCTKGNPYYWDATRPVEDRYFQSVKELDDSWDDYQRQQKMLTIRNTNAPVLFNYLEVALVDKTREETFTNTTYFDDAAVALKESMIDKGALLNRFKRRECDNTCNCHTSYRAVPHRGLKKLFFPRQRL